MPRPSRCQAPIPAQAHKQMQKAGSASAGPRDGYDMPLTSKNGCILGNNPHARASTAHVAQKYHDTAAETAQVTTMLSAAPPIPQRCVKTSDDARATGALNVVAMR